EIARILHVLGQHDEVRIAGPCRRGCSRGVDLGAEAVGDAAPEARQLGRLDLDDRHSGGPAEPLHLAAALAGPSALDQDPPYRGRVAAQRFAHGVKTNHPFRAHPSTPPSRATASAAIPSPRPRAPRPSWVVALRPTSSAPTPSTAAMRARIAALYGAIRGASATRVRSQLITRQSRWRAASTTIVSSSTPAASCRRGSPGGKSRPMSPRPAAPRIASHRACSSTSASL